MTASYVCQVLSAFAAFACRTVFIRELGAAYLGVNGLFSNVLGLLALAELGFGTAMNFEMYKPVAQGNREKIIALLKLYKKVYHRIALCVLIIGLILIPFIPSLVKDPGDIGDIRIYYIVYLINTVFGYYASYLFCLSNAEQKEYVSSYFSLANTVIINILQILVLLLTNSFLAYLLVQLSCNIIQQFAIRFYFAKKYDFLATNVVKEIDPETKEHIKKNLGGLIVSKLSDVLTHQTDNIIIALGLNIVTVGFADNYNLIVMYLKRIVLALLTSVVPSLGNMVATENRDKCYEIFKIYDLVDYLIYSFCTVCLVSFYQPFITHWAGADKVIDDFSMILLCASFYISGRSHSFSNYKTAFGVFYDVKITSIVSVSLNLALSVLGVYWIGLPGIYIGTCVSQLYSNIRTLRLAYNKLTGHSLVQYYLKRLLQVIYLIVPILAFRLLTIVINPMSGWIHLFGYGVIVCVLMVGWLVLLFHGTEEFAFVSGIGKKALNRIRGR